MKSLIATLLCLVLSAQAVAHVSADNRDLLNRSSRVNSIVGLGTELTNRTTLVKVTYDFTVNGGLVSTINLSALSAQIPNNAIVRQCWINTLVAPTSGGSATIALGLNTTVDLLAATAYTSFVTSGNAMLAGIPINTAATMVKATAARRITLTIGTAALTAGKIDVYCDYELIPS